MLITEQKEHSAIQKQIAAYFIENGLNQDYVTDYELFGFYLSNPQKQLEKHILKTMQKGFILLENDKYILIQWRPSLIGTEVLVKKTADGFRIVSAYPACLENYRNDTTVYLHSRSKKFKEAFALAESAYSFLDTHIVFDKEHIPADDSFEEFLRLYDQIDKISYCYNAFAVSTNDLQYKDFEENTPKIAIHTKMNELVKFEHLNRTFYLFIWDGFDGYTQRCDAPVIRDIPVIIPESILPKGTKLFSDDKIGLTIYLFGHEAICINPDEPELEEHKFPLIAHLSSERQPTREEYSLPTDDTKGKTTVELKNKPVEYMIRIFDETKSYEDQVQEQCKLFFEKYGAYPNIIVANPETYDKWFSVIENGIGDAIATETDKEPIETTRQEDVICEFEPDKTGKGTIFTTSEYSLHLVENKEFQEGVYELMNEYTTDLPEDYFMFPIIDAEATGKRIREVMNEKGVTPTMIQKVLGGISFSAIYKWFSGQALPRMDFFAVLSNMLNTSIDDLLVIQNQKRDRN